VLRHYKPKVDTLQYMEHCLVMNGRICWWLVGRYDD